MAGTKFDRFYVDELVKKYKKQEDLEALVVTIKAITATTVPTFQREFLLLVDPKLAEKIV
jgi:hypothetical protein